jgi:hypothetical protein
MKEQKGSERLGDKMNIRIFRYLMIFLLGVILIIAFNRLVNFITPKVVKYPTTGPSEAALSNAISRYKNGEISVVDLSTVTTFSWDRVYIFGPYTEFSKIDGIVGKSWRDSCFTTIQSSEGLSLLLFVNDHQAVGCIEYPRNMGDFAFLETQEAGFSDGEALFILDEKGRMVWIGDR